MRPATGLSMVAAAAVGALAAYFLDREQGARRRAVMRDKLHSGVTHLDEAGRVVAVDLRNRARGSFAALKQRVSAADFPDDVLAERVRAKLGRVSSHPGSIEVHANQGTVTLQGPILKREAKRVVRAVQAVRGVHQLVERLELHKRQENIPALQGGRARARLEQMDILQQRWAPATRFLVGGGGALLTLGGVAARSFARPLLMAAGVALLLRATTNMEARRLVGARGRRAIDFTKTLHIAAPLDKVYAFWSNFENFPKFMRNVREVRRNSEDSWHWEVAGPAGTTVQWDSAVTESIPGKLIAWATKPGSPVQHAGMVHFEEEGDGTRVQIQMSYNPPAGALGHVVASLFGAEPRAEMDEDLVRLQSYFETGKPPRDAAQAPF